MFIRDVLVWVTWAAAFLFPLAFSLFSRWWQSEMGWHLMSFSLVALASLTNSIALLEFGRYTGYRQVSFGLLVLTAVVIYWRLILYIRKRFFSETSE